MRRDPPALHRRADRRAGQHARTLEPRLDVERLEDRLDRALRMEELARDDAAEPPALVGIIVPVGRYTCATSKSATS